MTFFLYLCVLNHTTLAHHKNEEIMTNKEIRNFELYTTGIISIAWKDGDEDKFINIDLDLAAMMRMLQIEGLEYKDVKKASDEERPLVFHKAVIILFQEDDRPGQYYTSECFDDEDDPVVFHAEVK